MGLWLLLRLLLGLELLLLLTFSRHVVVVTCLLSLITKNLCERCQTDIDLLHWYSVGNLIPRSAALMPIILIT